MLTEFTNFVLGAGFNLAVALLIVRFIYYPVTQEKKYVFTFLAFNTIIYFVLGLLSSSNLSVGVGFGLFAIFSVLRYRTDEMPIREMTYLFIIIALPVMNSILISNGSLAHLLAANGVMVILLYLLEKGFGFHFEQSKKITYEKIELITPANQAQLLADLRQRTGLPVKRAEVGRIDFLRDTAEIKIYFDEPASQPAAMSTPGPAPAIEEGNHREKYLLKFQ
jgi:multisubunit Na+/H+ antiporter MnhE subunit